MGGPWEKYSKSSIGSQATGPSGPWSKYSKSGEAQKPKDSASTEAGLEGFGEGATLGYLNNIQAATEPLAFKALNALTGQNVEADDYLTARDGYNKRQEQLQKENPKSFGAGQIAGTIVSSLPVAKAAQGATMLARAGQAAKAGAVYGGLQNTSEKEGEITTLDHEFANRTENAATGYVLGGASSIGADAIAKAGSRAAQSVSNLRNKVGGSLKKSAESLAENSTGATGLQSSKFQKGAGRELLDNGDVQAFDSAENILEKVTKRQDEAGRLIGQSLQELDKKGVTASVDNVVGALEGKISELNKSAGNEKIISQIQKEIDNLVLRGESKVPVSLAEQSKRNFQSRVNWKNPDLIDQQASAHVSDAFKSEVEAAAKASPELAEQFVKSKKTFSVLDPIQEAAERRAAQVKQSPLGGLLDVGTAIGGGVASDDPATGLAAGIGMSIARRKVAPRMASTLAVTFDKISKQLLKDPRVVQIAQKSPDAFKSLVFGAMENQQGSGIQPLLKAAGITPAKGPEKWASDGANKILEHNPQFSQEQIEKLKRTRKGQELLIKASGKFYKPGSPEMDKLMGQLQQEAY